MGRFGDLIGGALGAVRGLNVPEAKQSAAAGLIALQTHGRPVWTPRNYEALAKEGFAANAIGYRCVRMISEAAARVPWLLYEGDAELSDSQ